MVLKVRPSAGCVACFARESTHDLRFVLLCATYLRRDVTVFYEGAGSVKAEA